MTSFRQDRYDYDYNLSERELTSIEPDHIPIIQARLNFRTTQVQKIENVLRKAKEGAISSETALKNLQEELGVE